jgi:outer membrane protein assembly factor BamE
MRLHPFSTALCGLAAVVALSGCSSLQSADNILGVITPYRIDVVQGNVVTSEQIARVKVGQSRSQVRDALGSPLLTDVFHGERWDYVFTIRRQGTEPQRRHVVLRFEGEALASIEAADLPAEQEFVSSIDTFKRSGKTPALALTDAQLQALPAPAKASASTSPEPAGPARTYPPLESR